MTGSIKSWDASYKKLFANPEVVTSFLEEFIPKEIRANMDLSTLRPLPSEHITPDNRNRKNDLVWKIRYGDSCCYLLIILEFQSTEDWWMAVRISLYSALLLQDIIKFDNLKKRDKLPLLFPIVLYNGNKNWQAPTNIYDLFFTPASVIDKYQIQQKYYLLDIKHLSDCKMINTNLAANVFALENAENIEEIIGILKNMTKILPENEKLQIHDAFINLLSTNIIDEPDLTDVISHCKTVQEAYAMFSEQQPRWKINLINEGISIGKQEGISIGKQEGISIGKQEGISIGVKNAIQEILINRFGSLSNDISNSLEKISNIGALKKLVIEAASTESLKIFKEKINSL